MDEKYLSSGKVESVSVLESSPQQYEDVIWYDPSKETRLTRIGLSLESFKRAPGPIKRDDDHTGLDAEAIAAMERETPLLPEKLKPRHVRMIAVGGSIGTGLFIGTGGALATGGPLGVLIAWMVMGFMLFNTIQAMGELSILYPVAGGFYNLSNRFVDKSWGFAMGWNYALQWAAVLPLEVTAASVVISYWDTGIPQGVWITIFLLVVITVTVFGAAAFGEEEFLSSCVKLFVASLFIMFSLIMVFGGGPKGGEYHEFVGSRYWHNPGPLAHGFKGVAAVFVTAAFSFSGTEVVGLAVTESPNPRKVMPGAIKMTFWRITLIYIVTLIFIGLLVPYNDHGLTGGGSWNARYSPFVIVVRRAGVEGLAHIVNAAICIAIMSIACSCVYAGSRTLHALGEQGYAPKAFAYVDKAGRPLFASIFVIAFGPIAYINLGPSGGVTFDWLLALTGLSTLFTWGSICYSHIRFRKAWAVQGHSVDEIPFQAAMGIWGSWSALVLIVLVLAAQFYTAIFPIVGKGTAEGFFKSYLALPIVVIMYIAGYFWKRDTMKAPRDIDLVSGRKVWDTAEQLNAERAQKALRPIHIRAWHFLF
ncbi:hypothetical protein FRB96_004975 [Tulasnella sp. 330]|nr:hypothetical protein FRB96_004975 [Tulasnella sp. 330]KAG8890250.1 hypothetical protein FRB98_000161 [Tulasnella sp. 332]